MRNSKVKAMLIVFFGVKGLVHHQFVPDGCHWCLLNGWAEKIEGKSHSSEARQCRQLEVALWRSTNPHLLHKQRLSGLDGIPTLLLTLLQSQSSPGGLFPVPPGKNSPQRTPTWDYSRTKTASMRCLKDVTEKDFQSIYQAWTTHLQRWRPNVIIWWILTVCSDI